MENISIADLSKFDFTVDKFQTDFLTDLRERGLISGKHLARGEDVREIAAIAPGVEGLFDFERAVGGLDLQEFADSGLPGAEPRQIQTLRKATEAQIAADPNVQKRSALLEASLQQIQTGSELLSGSMNPLGEDFARLFQETFGSQQATASGNRFFSGEQQFFRATGAAVAAQQFAESVLRSGLEGLQQADPLALPQGFLAQAQLASQQQVFNTLTQVGRKARTEAIRAATPSDAEKGTAFALQGLGAIFGGGGADRVNQTGGILRFFG